MTTPDLATIVDEQEAEIGRLRAELAVVRRDWQADVGTLTARAQTAEARAEQYENGRWHSYETVQAIVKEREELRAEAARLRADLTEVVYLLVEARRMGFIIATAETVGWAVGWVARVDAHLAALRGPAQSEKPAERRQEANDEQR